ncbi:MAG: 16S rRNA (guanine(527)-N(7))-methyltransferase RsmG [Acidobacteriales bacterium]|nr:16S rRNA (guanine(527)-N(7))-methyltransferase RsmG [Terriglobales bacterium]
MDTSRIAELLLPFHLDLDPLQLGLISTYVDLLERWNARMNLTAVRDRESIVTRHFAESLFAARRLFPSPPGVAHLLDLGSGAGFPGLPMRIWNPALRLTLIEANQKKSIFLREVVRALALGNTEVFNARAETYPSATADVVTLRAVERFDQVLPVAKSLLAPGGRLALLISTAQQPTAVQLLPELRWNPPEPVPRSTSRILLVGHPQ